MFYVYGVNISGGDIIKCRILSVMVDSLLTTDLI